MLYLRLADGAHLKLRGPAELVLPGGGSPLKLKRGAAWLAAGQTPLPVGLEPSASLQLSLQFEPEAQAALEARPAGDEAALVAVLTGVVNHLASEGDPNRVTQGQTLAVKNGSGLASIRTSKEAETAPWHKSFPPGAEGARPGQ
jgi:ferric-dicitrate binding protein FerR (iron transport regulator)